MFLRFYGIVFCLLFLSSCKDDFEKKYTWHTIKVTATAYNSLKNQTDSNPNITAYGDSLKPGMKYIAVSNDLIKKGLRHNTPVKIKGLEGIYFVKDRMHARWQNRIDIYMGIDVKAAKEWGRKKVLIDYGILKKSDSL
ncbi:MAG TPA: hypothetical protein VIS27_00930 [Yeosuana sp.]